MNCNHYSRDQVWESYTDDFTGEVGGHWVWDERSLFEDISLHSYRCSRCGHVGYYSNAGRLVEQQGITLEAAIAAKEQP